MYHRGTTSIIDDNTDGINYLYSLVKWTKERKFSLDNIKLILKYLENPQDKVKTIIVTGTNGKGSVSAMISSILGAAGYSVGLNISPHLVDINERILIDGKKVDIQELNEVANKVKYASERTGTVLSFHEAITVAAFLIFNARKLDFQVLEVGLGGRLDAANVVKFPVLSVLVSVDFDHEFLLGDTLEKIAIEKAGIFREGRKAIIGSMPQSVSEALESYCKKHQVISICYDKDFSDLDLNFTEIINLKGQHQIHNSSVAAQVAKEIGISDDFIKRGLSNVFWPARLEEISYGHKTVLVDSAHNPAGIKSLISYFKSRGMNDISIGFGVINSKRWQDMIDLLLPYVTSWNLLTTPSESAVNSVEIEGYLKNKSESVRNYDTNYEGYISSISSESGAVVIAGSIYLVGKIRSMLIQEERPIWTRDRVGSHE